MNSWHYINHIINLFRMKCFPGMCRFSFSNGFLQKINVNSNLFSRNSMLSHQHHIINFAANLEL
jgi:hypothetical protein